MSTIKLIIDELRKAKGITQSELANHMGVSFQAVSKSEKAGMFIKTNGV